MLSVLCNGEEISRRELGRNLGQLICLIFPGVSSSPGQFQATYLTVTVGIGIADIPEAVRVGHGGMGGSGSSGIPSDK